MSMQLQTQAKAATQPSFTPVRSGLLRRKCACGGSPGVDGECEACRRKRVMLQRKAISAPGSTSVQTKLAISQPGDQYEQEADRVVVEHVMRMPASTGPRQHGKPAQIGYPLMRQEAGSGLATTAAPLIVSEVVNSGNGRPLDDSARAFFEPRFGHNFSGVRVHTDTKAVKSAETVNALAYTVGRNIVFGKDHYAPPTTEGRKLLAHELTHVVQQARSQPLLQRQEESKKPSSGQKKQESSSKPTSKKPPEKISCDRSIYVFVDAPVPYPITSTPDHPPVGPRTRAPLPSSVCGGAGKTFYQQFNPNIRYQRLSNGDQYWWEDVPQKDGAWQRHYTVRKASETFCRFTYKPTTPCPSEVALKMPSEVTEPMSESELMHGAIVREGWNDNGGSIREFEDGAIETEDPYGKIWTFIPNDDGTYFGFNNKDDTTIESTTLDESMWDSYSFTR